MSAGQHALTPSRHYNTGANMGHSKVPLMFKKVPLLTFCGTFESASFTHAPKSFWGTLNKVPLFEFN
jgi:hypothetical protein